MDSHSKGLIAVFVVLCCLAGCSWYNSCEKDRKLEERLESKRQDSIRKAFVADSLAHDQHYQDSVRKAKEEYHKWEGLHDSICKEEIVGFIFLPSDSFYHAVFHPIIRKEDNVFHNYSVWDIPQLRFVSNDDIATNHYNLCPRCEEMESVYWKYEDGEILDVEDIGDYVRDNYEDFENIFEENRPEPDFYDDSDRW